MPINKETEIEPNKQLRVLGRWIDWLILMACQSVSAKRLESLIDWVILIACQPVLGYFIPRG